METGKLASAAAEEAAPGPASPSVLLCFFRDAGLCCEQTKQEEETGRVLMKRPGPARWSFQDGYCRAEGANLSGSLRLWSRVSTRSKCYLRLLSLGRTRRCLRVPDYVHHTPLARMNAESTCGRRNAARFIARGRTPAHYANEPRPDSKRARHRTLLTGYTETIRGENILEPHVDEAIRDVTERQAKK
jgi:hypothetical protein